MRVRLAFELPAELLETDALERIDQFIVETVGRPDLDIDTRISVTERGPARDAAAAALHQWAGSRGLVVV